MKIYISGKITGDPNYREKFTKAQKYLESKGHVVLNPAELPEGMEYEDYMHIGFAMIDVADAICMLCGWGESDGAVRENLYAKAKQKSILLQGIDLDGEL